MPAKRGKYAMTQVQQQLHLRWLLLDRITADPEFALALHELYNTYAARPAELAHWHVLADAVDYPGVLTTAQSIDLPTTQVGAYVNAVRVLATRWGLDRLIAPHEELGARLVHDWCQAARIGGGDVSSRSPALRLAAAWRSREIGEAVARSEWDLGDVRVVDQRAHPVVRVRFKDEWDPWREPRKAASERLIRVAVHQI